MKSEAVKEARLLSFAALLCLAFSLRTRIVVAAGLLVGYWVVMRYAAGTR